MDLIILTGWSSTGFCLIIPWGLGLSKFWIVLDCFSLPTPIGKDWFGSGWPEGSFKNPGLFSNSAVSSVIRTGYLPVEIVGAVFSFF